MLDIVSPAFRCSLRALGSPNKRDINVALTSLDDPSRFAIQDVASDGQHRLVLSGELDIAAAPSLEACLYELCADASRSIVLDLRKLTFMDSNGLRLTILARELCRQSGCELRLIQGPAQIRRLFEVTALVSQLPFDSTSDQSGPGTAR